MSTKRILGISAFGLLFIAIAIGLMLVTSYLSRDIEAVKLPDMPASPGTPVTPGPDTLDRVEVTRETVQAVVSTLTRPGTYSRYVTIESFWDDGQTEYNIGVAVRNTVTSLRIQPSGGTEKRIIVAPDRLYIWYKGDRTPYIGETGSHGDGTRTADEWQMLISYEDILGLNRDDITDAGYVEFGGETTIFAVHLSPTLGYTMKYYISVDLGLVTGAEEYDKAGALVYRMVAGECLVGKIDPSDFLLPDGTDIGTDG